MTTTLRVSSFFAVALLTAALVTPADAQTEIFGIAQNGDFSQLDPSNTPSQNATRRGGTLPASGGFFANNWALTSTAFGGIDQVRSSGDAGLLANNGVVTTGIAYATPGNLGFDEVPGGTGIDADVQPSGVFNFSGGSAIAAGSQIDFAFEGIDNLDGGVFDWTIGLLLDGETDINKINVLGTGTFTGAPGSTAAALYAPVSGSGLLTESASTFNLVAILENNTGGGVDQVGIDDIVLTYRDDITPVAIGDVQVNGNRDGFINIADFNEIRDNFFNTGPGTIDGDARGAVDGVVDLQDFLAWKNAFESQNSTVAASAVPEPSALFVLLACVMGAVAGRGRRG